MNLKDKLQNLDEIQINYGFTGQVENMYECKLPDDVKKIISVSDGYCSYDDNIIRMDDDLILDPEEDLGFDFKAQNLIPVFDCYDNDFICYDFINNIWCVFNTINESAFDSNSDILGLFKFE